MATITVIQSKRQQTAAGLACILAYCAQDFKTVCDGHKLCSGVNCMSDDAFREMMNTKLRYHKTDGRMYYHLVQSFSPEENISPEAAHTLALRFASEQFPGYEVQVSTHVDKEHLHSHFIVNAVSFETGRKYHSDKENIQRIRNASDRLCREQGLSIVEAPAASTGVKKMSAREYRAAVKGQSWKLALTVQINDVMKVATNKEEFLALMEAEGYSLRWTPERKYITYQCPNSMKCRDNKLHDLKYTKEMIELEFRIRAEIARRIAGADAPGEAGGRRRRSLLRRDGAELEGSADPGAEAQRAAADAAETRAGPDDGRRDEQSDRLSDGPAPQFRDGDGGADRTVSTEADLGSESLYERGADGSLRFVETGWERERLVFLRAAERAHRNEALPEKALLDLAPADGDHPALSVGLGALAAVGSLIDDDSEDPEERRRRMEANRAAENVGAVIGLAILLTRLALRRGDSPSETQDMRCPQQELSFPKAEAPAQPEAEPEEIENPYWLEAAEPQLVL